MYKLSTLFMLLFITCVHTNVAPKLLLMDITPQIIQCALIHSGYQYKIVKKYNVYIKAKLNVTVSRKAYISNYKEAFRIELL